MRRAALIKRVYEVDPLRCPNCGGEMKIIAFIERRDQPDVVESRPEGDGRSGAQSTPQALWIDVPLRSTITCAAARLTIVRLWDRPASRAPPVPDESRQLDLELQYVDTDSRPQGDGLPSEAATERSEVATS